MLSFTRHGLWEMVIGTIALGLFAVGAAIIWWPLAIAPFAVWVWLMAFFRDPVRTIPEGNDNWVSPADGLVTDIKEIENHELLGETAIRVGIFLNVFNVHVNRSPCDGVVLKTVYKKGKFINALKHDECSNDNESNTILLGDSSGKPIAVVKQIVGLIARRIVFPFNQGATFKRGDHMGMIKFGSRTELLIPKSLNPVIKVQVGQKVRGASDIIATVTR